MGADGIFQLKEPFPVPDEGPAEEHMGLDAHVLDLLDADDLLDVDAQKLVLLVLQPQPQGTDVAVGAAYGYHVYRPVLHLHAGTPPFGQIGSFV